jgi:radical S-adenosyl methionine domain-containing protein 2
MATLQQAKEALSKLAAEGMKKLNFAGGEPLLYPRFVGALAEFCKKDLGLESVSVVSNGSKVKESFFEKYAAFIDIFAVSCDSFDEETNVRIGRGEGGKSPIQHIYKIIELCAKYNVKFKMNTVVNRFNWQEDMNAFIDDLKPFRWKCFQVLVLDSENSGQGTKRNANGKNAFYIHFIMGVFPYSVIILIKQHASFSYRLCYQHRRIQPLSQNSRKAAISRSRRQ